MSLPTSANSMKPNTYEIFVDYAEGAEIKPIKIAYFKENEKDQAEQFMNLLKPRALYSVRLIVKGI